MAKRRKMGRKQSRRNFSKNAGTHGKNRSPRAMRGGYRL